MARTTRGKQTSAGDRGIPPTVADPPAADTAAATPGAGARGRGAGRHLVIVESPTKAKTINKYLGPGYLVMASVGHVRDLPSRSPKGVKQEVPGVDLEHDFAPTYEVLPTKKKTVADLRKAAKGAADVWFATDLDREGEAIAWHLAQALDVPVATAKRVVFNAITKSEIQHAFANPHHIDEAKVNAQQARRILDRLVGYQVSPLLWRKVAGGLSAGRVQSVAVRLVVEREREIEAFMPEEYWKVLGYFATDFARAAALSEEWRGFLNGATTPGATGSSPASADAAGPDTGRQAASGTPNGNGNGNSNGDDRGSKRSIREKVAWLSARQCLRGELVEFNGKPFEAKDRDQALTIAKALGFTLDQADEWQDPKGRGPAKFLAVLRGHIEAAITPPVAIKSIQTKRVTTRPPGPFITSTLQQAGANQLGFGLQRTMRIAQQLYEGVDLGGIYGMTGLITYMRTDSTHLSGEALNMARSYIGQQLGEKYLPDKPNFFASSNKSAQEAHEAVRPTDVTIEPRQIKGRLSEEQFKLYDLIWRRFVSCQMTSAEWDSTTVLIEAKGQGPRAEGQGEESSREKGEGRREKGEGGGRPETPQLETRNAKLETATFKATGRRLAFDGFYKVAGVPNSGDEAMLPELREGQEVAPLQIDPTQHFTSPPPRYTEASLQKKLEEEGIGRPSTYAAIIQTIQDRKYAQQVAPRDRRLMATDLGKVVTDKLVEAFPTIMDVAYTRAMESELDKVEEEHLDWVRMLHDFYGPFKQSLDAAHESMTHAKAEMEQAPHTCPKCEATTVYRFGKNGRFLSCSRYPDCDFAAPIDAEGNPMQPELSDIACPLCGAGMSRRTGRFGPFLGCVNYPKCKGIVNLDPKKGTLKPPKTPPLVVADLPCPKCGSPLNLRRSKRGPWLSCSKYPRCRGRLAWAAVEPPRQQALEQALAAHEAQHPQPVIKTVDGREVGDDYVPQVVGQEAGVKAEEAEAE